MQEKKMDGMQSHRTTMAGWMILRVGMGLLLMAHGLPKLLAGPDQWEKLGAMGMGALGIAFAPAVFGFLAAFSEAVGGLCVAFGLFTRPMAFLCGFTMVVATVVKVQGMKGPSGGIIEQMNAVAMAAGYPLALAVAFVAILLVGAGGMALGWRLCGRRWWT